MWILNMLMGLLALGFWNYQRGTEAFNVETKHYTVYTEERSSMFGFSVTEYRDQWKQGWVIVGAPEAQTSQPDVYRGGAVYRCDITTDNRCTMVQFDDKGNNYVKSQSPVNGMGQMDNKTLQWFGATVSSSYQDGGPLLACAPRYVWFSRTLTRREPVGTCWVTNFTNSNEFSPCRTSHWGYHRQGSCQAGLGATVSKDGDRLVIGAPGSWYWQGQIYSIDSQASYPYMPPGWSFYGAHVEEQGQAYSQSVHDKSKVIFTKEGPPAEDDSYMGYSVTSGDFVGDGLSGMAIGMPRGAELRGKVLIFNSNMVNTQNITGEQMGAYFGYALASGDIDGDGLDDLIIGAPMYTIPENPEKSFETGRIYVVYQGNDIDSKFSKVDSRIGLIHRGRFGLSLTSLGDIDRDGYGDFAVGAPYGGSEGRGAVYIYHGSRDGVLEKYSQMISADNLDIPVQTFGFSIAGGLDLDGNGYPDLVVGSYESNTAMFFRSRPVINMDSYVAFESDSNLINLDTRNCLLSDGSAVTCLPLRACFTYSGDGSLPRHDFVVQYVLDVKKTKSPRLFFLDHEGRNMMNHTIAVNRNIQFCRTVRVYVSPNIRDKLSSLDAEMRMSLIEEQYPDDAPRDSRSVLRPVLASSTSRKDTLSIRKNCGSDNICIPNLSLKVTPNVHRYLLGSGKRLELTVLVQNIGQDAFESMFNLKVPPGISYINIERGDNTEVLVQCSAPKQSNNNTLRCDIGNPLPANKTLQFVVLLQPVTSHGMKPTYEFEMEVNTTNPENNTLDDNWQHLQLPIWIETEIHVVGESKPKDLYYNPDNFTGDTVITELEFGPAVTHNYTIRNHGPSEILEAEAYLVWPAQTLAGEELLYLMEQPEVFGAINCDSAIFNYLGLKLDDRRKSYTDYADSAGIILDGSASGKTIGVQHESVLSEAEIRKIKLKESKVHASDISGIQRTRQKGGTTISETSQGQLPSDGNNPGIVTTTYVQNTITTGGTSGQGSNHHGQGIIHHESRGGTLDTGSSIFTGSSSEQETRARSNESRQFHHDWNNANARTDFEMPSRRIDQVERDHRYDESIRRQEQEGRRQEAKRIRQEQRRTGTVVNSGIYDNREHVYGTEKHFTDGSGVQEGTIDGSRTTIPDGVIGDREETVGGSDLGLTLHRINSTKDLELFFSKLEKDAAAYNIYNRRGKQYAMFDGRFRVAADGQEYIEFKDGSKFQLKNRYGDLSYTSSDPSVSQQSSFLRLEGELIVGQDGKQYIQLKDGRMFPLETSYTYTERRTYSSGGGPRESSRTYSSDGQESRGVAQDANEGVRTYGSSWQEESSNRGIEEGREFETHNSRNHEEEHSYEKKINTRLYGRDSGVHVPVGDNVPTNRPDQRRNSRYRRESDVMSVEELRRYEKRQHHHHHHRHRREDNSDYVEDVNASVNLPSCAAANCIKLRCTLGPLEKDQEVSISARYRVNARTLKKVAFNEQVKVSTQLVAEVVKQPFIGKPVEQIAYSYEIFTNVQPSASPSVPEVVPLWVVVLSACAGTIILLLLIYLLYKCGFFKRNRPTNAPERQPLNRNGHF